MDANSVRIRFPEFLVKEAALNDIEPKLIARKLGFGILEFVKQFHKSLRTYWSAFVIRASPGGA